MIKSETKQKILVLLLSGVAMAMARSPRSYFKIAGNIPNEFREIERKKLLRAIREFYNDRLIDYKEDKDGSVKIVLTKEGQKKALKFKLDEMKIKKPVKWDGEWRIVIFDIPEKFKKAREALRMKLKELGFLELQKSVLVLPYECEDEINFIVEIFLIRPFVRFIRAKSFTNEEQLKIKFVLY